MSEDAQILVLGVGNILLSDEGVGVHVLRRIERASLPANVRCLDGGTGSFQLLGPLQRAGRVVLIDAAVDGHPPGTLRCLAPRFSSDYPPTLTAHDIGLKDLLDAAYWTGEGLCVSLYTISITAPQDIGMELSPAVAGRLDEIVARILDDLCGIVAAPRPESFRGPRHA